MTALRLEGAGEWSGHWAGNGDYYAQRITPDAASEWYRVLTEEDEVLRVATRGRTPRDVPALAPEAASGPRPARRSLALVGRVGNARRASLTLLWSSRRRRA